MVDASFIEQHAKLVQRPTIEVSVGELVDKYSILDIKRQNIDDVEKLIHINFEIANLVSAEQFINQYPVYYKLLLRINKQIWDYTDVVKSMDLDHQLYPIFSNEIFELNQQRFRIKNYFNSLFPYSMKEQKSYNATSCVVKHPELNLSRFLDICVKYDVVSVLKEPSVQLLGKHSDSETTSLSCMPLPPNAVSNINNSSKAAVYDFSLKPIVYVATGLLGDFIMQLAVVCENYFETGQKGIIYMIGPYFRKGIEATYNDIAEVIKSQEYIEDLRVGEPEDGVCDIYLSSWRQRADLYTLNWYEMFLQEYGIHLGKHNWLKVPILCEWTNKTVVHISQYRFPSGLQSREPSVLKEVLLELEPGDHAAYTEKVGPIAMYKPASFLELCSIIYSCKQFIGALSMPLTLAHACGTIRQVRLCGVLEIDTMNIGLMHHMKNILKET